MDGAAGIACGCDFTTVRMLRLAFLGWTHAGRRHWILPNARPTIIGTIVNVTTGRLAIPSRAERRGADGHGGIDIH